MGTTEHNQQEGDATLPPHRDADGAALLRAHDAGGNGLQAWHAQDVPAAVCHITS